MFFRGTKPKKNPNRPGSKQDHFAVGLELESGKHLQPRLLYYSGHVSEGLVASVDTGSKSAFVGGGGGNQKNNGSLYSSGSLYSGK